MTSAFFRAAVTIPMDTGLPEDSAVNVWSFRDVTEPVDRAVDAAAIVTKLGNFYTAIASMYSSRVNRSGATIKIFDLEDPQPRVPFLETSISMGAETTANMDFPPEVAMCLSFRGAASSGANPRRRRGRIYLGPLQSTSTTDYAEVLAANITTVMAAVDAQLTPVSAKIDWCVYSPYTHHGVPVGEDINAKVPGTDTPLYPEVLGNLYASFTPITTYWMDNAWDTQRRRGTKATSRTTATA